MTIEHIDQLLTGWKTTIARVSQNLIDLQALPTYQRLTGEAGYPSLTLTGMTQTQVSPALEDMNRLFQYFDLLLQTCDRASALRRQMPRFLGAEEKIKEIEQLLTGASIQLPVVQIPLAQRDLLSAAETSQTISPEALLAAMEQAFQTAKQVVLAVDAAWSRLEPTLANAEMAIAALQQQANALGQGNLGELVMVQQTIVAFRDRLEHDPLGVEAEFEQSIRPVINQVNARLESLRYQRDQIQQTFAQGHHLLQQLTEVHQRSMAAFSERQAKVVNHLTEHLTEPPPLPQAQLDALSQWLTRLETTFTAGQLNPVQIGLENWMARTNEALIAEQAACAANTALLELRRELRGRLEALKAKALARGRAEDPTLATLAQQAKQLLYMRPTPLDQAAALVTQYEKTLNDRK